MKLNRRANFEKKKTKKKRKKSNSPNRVAKILRKYFFTEHLRTIPSTTSYSHLIKTLIKRAMKF